MNAAATHPFPRWLRWFYLAAAGLLMLTGFAQMPIFKRYYIADLPGLGWLAQYFVTHLLHYLGAVALLAILGYAAVDGAVSRRWRLSVGSGAWLQIGLLAGLVLTGALRVMKNYPGYYLSEGWIVFLDIAHLALALALLLAGLARLIVGRRSKAVRP
jgi:hypothetical protein